MNTSHLRESVEALPAADRGVLDSMVATFEAVTSQLNAVTEALELFDRLDDQREAELRALRARVRILTMHATGELSSAAVADVFATTPPIVPESIRVEKLDAHTLVTADGDTPSPEDAQRFVTSQREYSARRRASSSQRERIQRLSADDAPTYRVVGPVGQIAQGLPRNAADLLAGVCGARVEEEVGDGA